MAKAFIEREKWVNGLIANLPEIQLHMKKQAAKLATRAQNLALSNADTGHLASTVKVKKDLKYPATYEISFEDNAAAYIELGHWQETKSGPRFVPGKYIMTRAMRGDS